MHTQLSQSAAIDSASERDAYIKWLKTLPTRYHLTLSFKHGMSERLCVEMLNELLKRINREILKNRFNKKGEAIKGMAVREFTDSLGTVHFHILVVDKENKLPDYDKLYSLLKRKIEKLNERYEKRNKISDFDLQDYYEGDEYKSLEKYVTKIFEKTNLSLQQKRDSLCPLGYGGVSFN